MLNTQCILVNTAHRCFSTGVNFAPSGHVAMSADILGVLTGTRECLLMASIGQKPEILLNILQSTDQPLQQRIMWFKMQ